MRTEHTAVVLLLRFFGSVAVRMLHECTVSVRFCGRVLLKQPWCLHDWMQGCHSFSLKLQEELVAAGFEVALPELIRIYRDKE